LLSLLPEERVVKTLRPIDIVRADHHVTEQQFASRIASGAKQSSSAPP
jgi:hypothetical protein